MWEVIIWMASLMSLRLSLLKCLMFGSVAMIFVSACRSVFKPVILLFSRVVIFNPFLDV